MPSDYNRRLFVVDQFGFRALRFGTVAAEDQTRIRLGHPEQLPMPYLRGAAIGLAVPDNLRRALIVGLGGGAFASYLQARHPGVRVDAVEIDPAVVAIARSHFALEDGDTLTTHVVDAVDYVRQRHAPYDYILLDAYDADDLPDALLARRFLGDVRRQLAEGGVVVANVAVHEERRARYVICKLARRYHHCLRIRSTPSNNDVLLLSARPLPDAVALKVRLGAWEPGTEAGLAMHRYVDAAQPCLADQPRAGRAPAPT